jgi:hypothetical protein
MLFKQPCDCDCLCSRAQVTGKFNQIVRGTVPFHFIDGRCIRGSRDGDPRAERMAYVPG